MALSHCWLAVYFYSVQATKNEQGAVKRELCGTTKLWDSTQSLLISGAGGSGLPLCINPVCNMCANPKSGT